MTRHFRKSCPYIKFDKTSGTYSTVIEKIIWQFLYFPDRKSKNHAWKLQTCSVLTKKGVKRYVIRVLREILLYIFVCMYCILFPARYNYLKTFYRYICDIKIIKNYSKIQKKKLWDSNYMFTGGCYCMSQKSCPFIYVLVVSYENWTSLLWHSDWNEVGLSGIQMIIYGALYGKLRFNLNRIIRL